MNEAGGVRTFRSTIRASAFFSFFFFFFNISPQLVERWPLERKKDKVRFVRPEVERSIKPLPFEASSYLRDGGRTLNTVRYYGLLQANRHFYFAKLLSFFVETRPSTLLRSISPNLISYKRRRATINRLKRVIFNVEVISIVVAKMIFSVNF